MSNRLASLPEYEIELVPGYVFKLKLDYLYDKNSNEYMVKFPMELATPHGEVKSLWMMKESTFKTLIAEHGGTALRLFALVKSHFSSFRPMMKRSQVGL